MRRHRRIERGETLIESLVAITVLALVAAASFVGMRTALGSSSDHHEGAVAETLLRSAAERIQDPTSTYIPRAGCSGGSTYSDLPSRAGFPITVSVTFWNAPATSTTVPTSMDTTFSTVCPATASADPGLQRVALTVTMPSGDQQRLDVLKRAN